MSSRLWKPVAGYSGYAVSSMGDVWSFYSNCLLQGSVKRNRRSVYLSRHGSTTHVFVSRLVAIAFVSGESEEHWSVNHKDGDSLNDSAANLEWCSLAGQHIHMKDMNLHRKGEEHSSSILDDDMVRDIALMCANGTPQSDIADDFGISQSTVSGIHTGKSWGHVTGVSRKRTRLALTDEQRKAILSSDKTPIEVSEDTSIPLSTVYRVLNEGTIMRTDRPCFDGEEWSQVDGYPGYDVSSHGRIWSRFKNKLLQTSKPNRGIYVHVALSDGVRKHHVYVHRLVAMLFVEGRSPIRDVVDHRDGNGVNNHKDNLEWVSQKENLRRAKDRTRNQRIDGHTPAGVKDI